MSRLTRASVTEFVRRTSACATADDDWPAGSRLPHFSFLPSMSIPEGILVITKPLGLLTHRVLECAPPNFSVFARYGPLCECHVERIRTEYRMGASVIRFVGDLDPLDLTAYATLEVGLRDDRCTLEYTGVGARWLEICRKYIRRAVAKELPLGLPVMAMTKFERRVFRRLSRLTDLEELIGTESLRVLESGHKLELEGASNPVVYRKGLAHGIQALIWG